MVDKSMDISRILALAPPSDFQPGHSKVDMSAFEVAGGLLS